MRLFELGERVVITKSLKRERFGDYYNKKRWVEKGIKATSCIFIGTRTLQNGKTVYEDGYSYFEVDSYVNCCLVVASPRQNPIRVPLHAISKEDFT